MAERRRRDKALSGLGEGLQAVSSFLLQQVMADRKDARQWERQREVQQNIDERAIADDQRRMLSELGVKVAGDELLPEQAAQLYSTAGGRPEDAQAFDAMRPPLPRRRAVQAMDKRIADAAHPDQMPGLDEIAQLFTNEGVDFGGEWPAGLDRSLQLLPDAVQPMADRASVRRRALMERPTQMTTITRPDGSTEQVPMSLYGGPVQTAPDAAGQGTIEGTKETAKLLAGPTPDMLGTRAGQQERAQLAAGPTPQLLGTREGLQEATRLGIVGPARTRQAANEAAAREGATIDARLSRSAQLLKFEREKALDELALIPNRVHAEKWAGAVASAEQSSLEGLKVMTTLQDKWQKAAPEILQLQSRGILLPARLAADVAGVGSETELQIIERLMPRGMMPQAVRDYYEFAESIKPLLARAFQSTGGLTEQEQTRAGLAAPNFMDAASDAGNAKIDNLISYFTAGPAMLQLQKPGTTPLGPEERLQFVQGKMREIQAQRRQSRTGAGAGALGAPGGPEAGSGLDLMLTPGGLQIPSRRPGGR